MKRLVLAMALCGCQQLLGIEDPTGGTGDAALGGDTRGPDGPGGMLPDGQGSDLTGCATQPAFAGSVSYSAPGARSVAVGQLDPDGVLDLVVATTSDVVIFSGTGAGALGASHVLHATPTAATGVAVADVDHDGLADVITWEQGAGSGAPSLAVHLQNAGGGTFATPVATTVPGIEDVLVTALDGDALPDLVVTTSSEIVPYYGSAAARGTFAAGTAFGSGAAALLAADLDGDGLGDAVLWRNGQVEVAFGLAGSAFQVSAVGPGNATNAGAGHYASGEGARLDLAIQDGNGGLLFSQASARAFTETNNAAFSGLFPNPVIPGQGLSAVDLDRDGRDDIVQQGRAVLQCAQLGTFDPQVATFGGVDNDKGVNLFVDLNVDGKLDLIELDNAPVQSGTDFVKVSLGQ